MTKLLFAVAVAAAGFTFAYYAVKRAVDFNERRNPDPVTPPRPIERESVRTGVARSEAERELTARGEPWWPLWNTSDTTN